MRPYNIPQTDTWIDLDHVQSINEPTFLDRMGSGGYFIVLGYQLAFGGGYKELWFDQDAEHSKGRSDCRELPEPYNRLSLPPVMAGNGEPDNLVNIRDNVFKPFFDAWTNTGD